MPDSNISHQHSRQLLSDPLTFIPFPDRDVMRCFGVLLKDIYGERLPFCQATLMRYEESSFALTAYHCCTHNRPLFVRFGHSLWNEDTYVVRVTCKQLMGTDVGLLTPMNTHSDFRADLSQIGCQHSFKFCLTLQCMYRKPMFLLGHHNMNYQKVFVSQPNVFTDMSTDGEHDSATLGIYLPLGVDFHRLLYPRRGEDRSGGQGGDSGGALVAFTSDGEVNDYVLFGIYFGSLYVETLGRSRQYQQLFTPMTLLLPIMNNLIRGGVGNHIHTHPSTAEDLLIDTWNSEGMAGSCEDAGQLSRFSCPSDFFQHGCTKTCMDQILGRAQPGSETPVRYFSIHVNVEGRKIAFPHVFITELAYEVQNPGNVKSDVTAKSYLLQRRDISEVMYFSARSLFLRRNPRTQLFILGNGDATHSLVCTYPVSASRVIGSVPTAYISSTRDLSKRSIYMMQACFSDTYSALRVTSEPDGESKMYYETTMNTLSVEAHVEEPSSISSTSIDSMSNEMQMEYDYLLEQLSRNEIFSETRFDIDYDPVCRPGG